ncbi:DUF6265 family protein [Sphingomonas panacisoli]|nr:DUF6265 family protein [Sphingomonas panacisoli]
MRRLMVMGLALLATGASNAPAMPGWMSGCWLEQKGPNWTEECWTGPRADHMMGSGRDGRGDQVKSWETMQIERGADGTLVFYGSVKGGKRVAFPMVSSGPRDMVFANPSHDYPQRIHYWREGMGLNAEISLMDGSQKYGWKYGRQGGN